MFRFLITALGMIHKDKIFLKVTKNIVYKEVGDMYNLTAVVE